MEKIKTRDVLKVVAVTGIIIATPLIPSLPFVLMQAHKAWKNVRRQDLGRIIKRLEKQKLIDIKENGNQTAIEITEKGRRRLLQYDFENMKIKNKKRDGKWRLIIFDIPERKKRNRDALRKKLIQLDCVRLQDSVFVSAFPCKEEIDFLVHYLEIVDYVTVIAVVKIERGEDLIFKKYKDWDNDTL